MDLAGGTVATRRAKGRTATVAITAMTFHRPVFIGDEVTCYAGDHQDRHHIDHGEGRELGAPRHRGRAHRGNRGYLHLRRGRQ